MRILILLPLSMCMAYVMGCAPNTAAGVREQAAATSVLTVPKNYQYVYKQLREELSRCYELGAWTATQRVEGELYTELKQGELTVGLYGAAIDLYLVVDIEATGDAETTVESAVSLSNKKGYIDKVEEYLVAGKPMCKG